MAVSEQDPDILEACAKQVEAKADDPFLAPGEVSSLISFSSRNEPNTVLYLGRPTFGVGSRPVGSTSPRL